MSAGVELNVANQLKTKNGAEKKIGKSISSERNISGSERGPWRWTKRKSEVDQNKKQASKVKSMLSRRKKPQLLC